MEMKSGLVYLVFIQEVCWNLLMLQSHQCVLELCLEVLHLTEDQSLSSDILTLTLGTNLLTANDLMRKSKDTPCVQTVATNLTLKT